MALKNGDFISINFTGRDESGDIFDTTKEDIAKKHGLDNRNVSFSPIDICIGKGFVLEGLDEELVGKTVGESFSVTLPAEKAFGKKRGDMIKLMPLKEFKKQGVKPVPGLQLNIDGTHGTIKSVTGNRVIVDFNNPLSGQEITYDVEIVETVDDLQAQVEAVSGRLLRFKPDVKVDDSSVSITLPIELPEDMQKQLSEAITEMTSASAVDFSVKSPEAPGKA